MTNFALPVKSLLRHFMISNHFAGLGTLRVRSFSDALNYSVVLVIGAIELKIFGAQIYVASLVGIGIVRFLGVVVTAVIMSGRTDAADGEVDGCSNKVIRIPWGTLESVRDKR